MRKKDAIRNKLDIIKQEFQRPEYNIKEGDLVTFTTHSSVDDGVYKGVVEYKSQIGLVVYINGVQYEIQKVLISKINSYSINSRQTIN